MDVPDFSQARVLVTGDVMLDRYWRGPCARISPEAPVPVVKVDTVEERPGGAANVAVNIASLGAQASLIGLTGADEAAQILQVLLTARGVKHDLLALPQVTTIAKLRVLSHNQQLLRLDFEDGFPGFAGTELTARLREQLPAVNLVVLSDYGKGTLRAVQALIETARAVARPVVVDPKGQDFGRYRGATVLTPNFAEFQAVVGPCPDEATLEDKGRQLLAELELAALLVTRSEKGMSLLSRAGQAVHLPTQVREVFDVTGAGDTVVAVLAASLAAGAALHEAMRLANVAAGLVVGKLGTASVSLAELRQALHVSWGPAILDEPQLLQAVAEARARGARIVMTNGCFDILHAGHVGYLEQARKRGDRLIVAVNDDVSVRRLKGTGRPINPLAERLRVLAGLAAVDWLIAFTEDTPERLICTIKPDVLVKGGDYQPDQIAGSRCVLDAGGEVVVLDYLEGCSTSALIERLKEISSPAAHSLPNAWP